MYFMYDIICNRLQKHSKQQIYIYMLKSSEIGYFFWGTRTPLFLFGNSRAPGLFRVLYLLGIILPSYVGIS